MRTLKRYVKPGSARIIGLWFLVCTIIGLAKPLSPEQAVHMALENNLDIKIYTAHLENVRAQYSVGNVAKADVLQSEVELADAQQTLLKTKNSYEVALNNLKNLIRWKGT